MRWRIAVLLICLSVLAGCSALDAQRKLTDSPAKPAPSTAVEGRDYLLLERVRFHDDQGYIPATEAFSVLIPRGWKSEGGSLWKSPFACAAEMQSFRLSLSSPDGAIRYTSLPVHAWGAASDPMMMQSLMAAAQQGGCEVSGPRRAADYLQQVLLARELSGASVASLRPNPAVEQNLAAGGQRVVDFVRSRGGQGQVQGEALLAELRWPDGRQGLLSLGVTNIFTGVPNPMTGAVSQIFSGLASERAWIEFPPQRREEAERILVTLRASFRTNPAWRQRMDEFNAQLRAWRDQNHSLVMQQLEATRRQNEIAHRQRMADIQARGQANTAAFNQRMSSMDANLRSWDASQESSDRIHKQFVQSIREVETWKGSSGAVELSAGYAQAWTRGDGTYLLSNKPGFDPSSVFRDPAWQELKRER